MKEIRIENIQDNIQVTCPHCNNWEQQSSDQQRNHLQTFDIVDWLDDLIKHKNDSNGVERSHMKCLECGKEFVSLWDYDEILNQDMEFEILDTVTFQCYTSAEPGRRTITDIYYNDEGDVVYQFLSPSFSTSSPKNIVESKYFSPTKDI